MPHLPAPDAAANRRHGRALVGRGLGLAAALLAGSAAAQPQPAGQVASEYRLVELSRDPDVVPSRMNSSGVIVGQHRTAGMPIRATQEGGYTFLPLSSPLYTRGTAVDVNEAGSAVGWQLSDTAPGRAVLWPATGGVVDLAAGLDRPEAWTYAVAINDAGQVAGMVRDYALPGAPGYSVVWSADGTLKVLPKPRDVQVMRAQAINGQGHVVGELEFDGVTPVGSTAGFFWSPRTGVKAFAPATRVLDVNDRDEVVGMQDATGPDGQPLGHGHAFYWSPALGRRMPQHLPMLPGFLRCVAMAISPDSVIAGYCEDRKPQLRPDEFAAVAWDRQPDGSWQVHDLKTMTDRNPWDNATKVRDIDAAGRMLYTVEGFLGIEREATGIAVPVHRPTR
ncbi:MAG: hypothetical protein HY856_09045 [Burkholderiales bacterium]|nr:hypothetical protein [Burkholderiales bacterium]